MEFLILMMPLGVPVRRGYEPWGVGEKGQNMEIVIMEKIN